MEGGESGGATLCLRVGERGSMRCAITWRSTDCRNIQLVLDPKRKLKYFCSAGWEENWIETACKIVVANLSYSHMVDDIDEENNSEAVSSFLLRFYCANYHFRLLKKNLLTPKTFLKICSHVQVLHHPLILR